MNLKFSLTNESATVIDNGKTHVVRKGTPNFVHLVAALEAGDETKARGYLTVKQSLETWANGLFKYIGGKVMHGDNALPDSLSQRIFTMITNGEDPQSLLNFWERLQKNPSWRSVQQLWGFMANKGIPIDQDGFILAYKAVNADWTDCHTGQIFNTVGSVHDMPRNQISDDPNEACHFGFHVGALGYAETFGPDIRKMIICKVDPADVVCIPYDSGQQKMRTCHYEVIGVHSGKRMSSTVEDTRNDPAVKASKQDAKKAQTAAANAKENKEKAKLTGDKGHKPRKVSEHAFDAMDSLGLMEQNLGELRTYAATNLHIVGASKLPGGKTSLVARIEEVRG